MAIITRIIPLVVLQAGLLHQQGHQLASQRDLQHQHLHDHPLHSHPMPPGVLLHRLNPQHQRNLLQQHPDQVQVQVREVHPVPGAEEAEGDSNPPEQNRFITMIFLLNLNRNLFNYIIIS